MLKIVMLLGITDMEAEQTDEFAFRTGMYGWFDPATADVADLKGFYAFANDEMRREMQWQR